MLLNSFTQFYTSTLMVDTCLMVCHLCSSTVVQDQLHRKMSICGGCQAAKQHALDYFFIYFLPQLQIQGLE